ncbi:flagellar motor switch protein FliN [Desulfosporosinus acididurans]|uniref:Flagellar motor switch protein FliN n=1 Tax=Desulfosporosinus acididurans TaxID=476652 RepID=A0A0J1FQ20_9FIRM|nr:flagellar motor switch phosphatase FliY [Desulfosporosinus acididurans]KLU65048.1 flagellar motor switch protein FliN [Desulfosporosinus acididurans]
MGNEILSQEEINALLQGTLDLDSSSDQKPPEDTLNDMEKDTLGEIANISMGTAATTLSLLLGKKVDITTPKVDITTSEQIMKDYPVPSVICNVKYKEGIEGSNLLILSQQDGSVIVDLMMGGDGKNPTPGLSDLQISGISEAMNQMMGSAATSMSTMFKATVDITPPDLVLNDLSADKDVIHDTLSPDEPLVRISFRMIVEDVIDSTLIQVIPLSVAQGMVNKLMAAMNGDAAAAAASQPAPPQQSMPNQEFAQVPPLSPQSPPSPPSYEAAYPPGGYPPYGGGQPNPQTRSQTPVQPVQFAPLQQGVMSKQPENLNLILDVPLQISVELGRTKKTIKEILEMGPGSVVELDRLAGEAVDMIVNGKLIAKCEVVVVNETFGIRITDIVQPTERISLNS